MPDYSKRKSVLEFLIATAILTCALPLASCAGQGAASQTPPSEATPMGEEMPIGDPQKGAQAIGAYRYGRCHTIPGIHGADGTFGPPLTDFAKRPTIAGRVRNTPDNLIQWIRNPKIIKPNTEMPNYNVTWRNARDIAAYLYTLK